MNFLSFRGSLLWGNNAIISCYFFKDIEQSALDAICTDSAMKLMVGTLSRVSGLKVSKDVKVHALDRRINKIRADRIAERERNGDDWRFWQR